MTLPPLFYREIPLSRGKVAMVDLEDFEWLNRWKWCAQQCSKKKENFYAVRWDKTVTPRAKIQMHLAIMGVERGIDHHNHDTLDNRRHNLRPSTARQQSYNRRISSRNTLGYKGIRLARSKRYVAGIRVDGKQIYLGTYDTKREAALAYNRGAIKYHGEFACLNEID